MRGHYRGGEGEGGLPQWGNNAKCSDDFSHVPLASRTNQTDDEVGPPMASWMASPYSHSGRSHHEERTPAPRCCCCSRGEDRPYPPPHHHHHHLPALPPPPHHHQHFTLHTTIGTHIATPRIHLCEDEFILIALFEVILALNTAFFFPPALLSPNLNIHHNRDREHN